MEACRRRVAVESGGVAAVEGRRRREAAVEARRPGDDCGGIAVKSWRHRGGGERTREGERKWERAHVATAGRAWEHASERLLGGRARGSGGRGQGGSSNFHEVSA